MAYGFYPFLGMALFWISLIIGIILFANYKKIYPVFYMISVALYIFTAGFAIDVFNIAKFGILSILVISAIIFMGLGHYFSKIVHHETA
ncbi:hypothetical protein HN604_03970 [archaeon]|jgi:hypothetical protein|nr:hypothetical protein [archaeon]MBT6182864.1 hypothetical protein [archaeon]MBT6606733.1 hypothetical protein [archaeon]MBT7251291.1 hypothetical protein [archaeon]MBT7661207.1 hypothetical protein [archaeon]